MDYKTILVHLNDEHRAAGLLAAAIGASRANGAHLIALCVLPPTIIIPGIDGDPGAVIDDHRTSYAAQMTRMQEAFEKTAGAVPALSYEWRALDCETENPFGIAASVVAAQARCADLVIASQANPEWSLSGHLDVAEEVIMESGRPVLVMPKSGGAAAFGQRVVVAWNGRREAARAAFDAMPFLKAASDVRVVWLNPENEKQAAGPLPGFELCEALARHGVKCEAARRSEPGAGAGAALLSAVDEFKADMLVMGCYGHSRLREMVLGGASRHVMQHARVPVLMAH